MTRSIAAVLAAVAAIAAVADAQNYYVRIAIGQNATERAKGVKGFSAIVAKSSTNQVLCLADYENGALVSHSKVSCNGTHLSIASYSASDTTCTGSTITPPSSPSDFGIPDGAALPWTGSNSYGEAFLINCFDAGTTTLGSAFGLTYGSSDSSCSTATDNNNVAVGVCTSIDATFGTSTFQSFDYTCIGANAWAMRLYATTDCSGTVTQGDTFNASCLFDSNDNEYNQISGICSSSNGSTLQATQTLPTTDAASAAAPSVWLAAVLTAGVAVVAL